MEFDNADINVSKQNDTAPLQSPSPQHKSVGSQKTLSEKTQELIIMNSVKKTKRLEIYSIVLSLFMVVLYNLMPLIVVVQMKNAGIVNNKGFYENDDVMNAWMAYLIFNLVIESIIATTICIVSI